MLTEQEILEIEQELKHFPTRRSGCIEALKVVQSHRGWISDESILDIAHLLGMTPAELDQVATFYNLIFRQPVGKHVILVCDSVCCWLTGQETILDYLKKKLGIEPGQTTSDGLFTLLPTVCLGHCDQAPVMMLDGEVIGNLTKQKIDEVLDKLQTYDGTSVDS